MSQFQTCTCPPDATYCDLYKLRVDRRTHQYLRGDSGLPRDYEEVYVARLLGVAYQRPQSSRATAHVHGPCQCEAPTETCPRYGWMMGHKWQECQGHTVDEERRQHLLRAYQEINDRASQPPEPSWIAKGINFGMSVVRHIATGAERADEPVIERRLAACKQPCRMLLPTLDCAACGCPVEVKATWKNEPCPLGKWPGETAPIARCGGCGSKPPPSGA